MEKSLGKLLGFLIMNSKTINFNSKAKTKIASSLLIDKEQEILGITVLKYAMNMLLSEMKCRVRVVFIVLVCLSV